MPKTKAGAETSSHGGGGGEDGGECQRQYLQTRGRVSRLLIYSSCRMTIGQI